ncbi:MAG TPA: FG-GAP-like repeat-containing protein [Saprospiraceae bacterium]|nr:FG-GAP-like repeat-containing protein [Saprospiraceae bacterium]HMQ85839.1 FG-GAP-like repeat-containing protein [Saprospiraceae bacterium]
MSKPTACAVALLIFVQLSAQETAYLPANFPFYENGQDLAFPLTGGLETPQFTAFSLNGDEWPDLLVFDRVGNVVLPFLAVTQGSSVQYVYQPEFIPFFPPLYQLLLTGDLNCDGLEDLVTTRQQGGAADVALEVYLQKAGLQFESAPLHLMNNGSDSLLRIHAFDLPTLKDINGDALLDLIYIPQSGVHFQYYENVSGNDCSLLQFQLADDCWGDVAYQIDGTFEYDACDPGRPQKGPAGCAGSATLAWDYNADGEQDLLFSGLYDKRISLMIAAAGELQPQNTDWLAGGMELSEFPAPFLLDVDQDGETDLVAATNRVNGVGANPELVQQVFFFQKSEETGSWSLVQNDWMIREMLDPGFRSSPAVWDVDNDGLLDILLAYNRPHPIFGYSSALAYYRNIGTAEAPAFEWVSDDFSQLSVYLLKAMHLSIGDINSDGRTELVVGTADGQLKAFSNSELNPQFFTPMPFSPLEGIQLDGFVKPQLTDWNRDGLLDILCGTENGSITYLENQGTTNQPVFQWISDTLGGLAFAGLIREISPFWLLENETNAYLWLGQADGRLGQYTFNEDDLFEPIVTYAANLDVGERASICLSDLDADGLPELLLGNMRGGLQIFQLQLVNELTKTGVQSSEIGVFPNPLNKGEELHIRWPMQKTLSLLRFFDLNGRLLYQMELPALATEASMIFPFAESGLYFYQLTTQEQLYTGGVMVK